MKQTKTQYIVISVVLGLSLFSVHFVRAQQFNPVNNGGLIHAPNTQTTTPPTNTTNVTNTYSQTNTGVVNNGGLVNNSNMVDAPTPGGNPTPTPGGNPTPTPGGNPTPTPGGNPTVSSDGVAKIKNPITGINDLPSFVSKVLGIILKIAIPLVAAFIIYAGLMFVLARGNTEKLEAAKRRFLYTLIGTGILLGAWMIATVIEATIKALMA
jgi:hypothetical protein